jgi:hypothetical protein|uniref:DUF3108 domain-containing protein n=1 Tax=candidate division WOR-3 bacterium TaxID=2052148 RepID=A0A7C6A8U1_UNCW3
MLFSLIVLFLTLPIGETLHYTLQFGPLRVGTLDLKIEDLVIVEKETSYHFVAHLKSNPSYRFLFQIDDQLESYTRLRDFATWQSIKRVSEGNYKNQTQANFDYAQKKIFYSDSSVFDLAPETKDLLSTWYYFRTLNLKPNETLTINVHMDKKDYRLLVVTIGPMVVSTGIGKLECLMVKPKLPSQYDIGTVYLTNDVLKIPAMIKKRFSFGNIVAVLTKIGRIDPSGG